MNKRSNPVKTLSVAALSGLALALAGCGGGGDDAPAVTAAVPAQASTDSASFTEYVRQLVASVNVDDLMPVDLSMVSSPPEDNDSPPVALSQ